MRRTLIAAALLALTTCGSASGDYRGQWYGCCTDGTDYYSGPTATFPTFQRPMAAFRDGRTFFVYGGRTHAEIGVYDHATATFAPPRKLGRIVGGDGHRNPSLLIAPDGRLWVFFGSHGDDTKVWRSRLPGDTRRWEKLPPIEGETAYPQPMMLNGRVIVLHRRGLDQAATTWTGEGWSPPVTLIDGRGLGVYAISAGDGRRVHLIWTTIDLKAQQRRHVWTASFSEPGLLTGRMILNSGDDQVQTSDLQLDAQGRPWALVSSGGPAGWRYHVIGPEGTETVARTDHQFDVGALIVGRTVRAYVPVPRGGRAADGGDMVELTRGPDGWTSRTLAAGPGVRNYARTVQDGRESFRVFWSEGDAETEGPVTLTAMGPMPRRIEWRETR